MVKESKELKIDRGHFFCVCGSTAGLFVVTFVGFSGVAFFFGYNLIRRRGLAFGLGFLRSFLWEVVWVFGAGVWRVLCFSVFCFLGGVFSLFWGFFLLGFCSGDGVVG